MNNLDISLNILYDFLNIYCKVENNFYIFDMLIYKKYEYNNILDNFKNSLNKFYLKKNYFYLNRENSFNNFLTIIRHLCKKLNINYKRKIKYDKSTYNIIYYIEKI